MANIEPQKPRLSGSHSNLCCFTDTGMTIL